MIRYLSLQPRMTSSKDFPFQAFFCVWRHHRQDSSLSSFQSRRNHSWCVQISYPLYRSLFFEIYEWAVNEFRYLLFWDSPSDLLLSGGPWRCCDIDAAKIFTKVSPVTPDFMQRIEMEEVHCDLCPMSTKTFDADTPVPTIQPMLFVVLCLVVCSHCRTPRLIKKCCIELCGGGHTVQRQTPTEIPFSSVLVYRSQSQSLCLSRFRAV